MLDTVISLEDTFLNWAHLSRAAHPTKPHILICDRGCMDGKSFVSDATWTKVMVESGHTEAELLSRCAWGHGHVVMPTPLHSLPLPLVGAV